MYQVYTFPPSHYNSRTLYYMTTTSTINLDATDVPSKKVLKARKQKQRNRGREIAKITDKRYLCKI